MILYFIKSTVCLAIVLLFYKAILEESTIHKFKRSYLLLGLILSVIIPFLPTGYNFTLNESPSINFVGPQINSPELISLSEAQSSALSGSDILVIFILGISCMLLIKSSTKVLNLWRKSSTDQVKISRDITIILLDENVPPHTFFNKIFVNNRDYKNGKISDQLLAHEQAHAIQRHSIDIVLIEVLICIFWFNPLIRIYKNSIQLNHEFLADEDVINRYKNVTSYRHLLWEYINNNNQISLASNINFKLTKKRLEMMTKKSTTSQRVFLKLSVLPLTFLLLLAFGNPISAQSDSVVDDKATIQKDNYFQYAFVNYKDDKGRTIVKNYHDLPEEIKRMIPPPPPVPPSPDGTLSDVNQKPLRKGTMISITETGKVIIADDSMVPPPPPPAPPSEPSKVPPAPPAPPAPPTVSDLVDQGAEVYLNGSLVKPEVTKTICEKLDGKTMKVKKDAAGNMSIYITTDD
mgnify:CR=1 FL=1